LSVLRSTWLVAKFSKSSLRNKVEKKLFPRLLFSISMWLSIFNSFPQSQALTNPEEGRAERQRHLRTNQAGWDRDKGVSLVGVSLWPMAGNFFLKNARECLER
jgi:hypothetical protein